MDFAALVETYGYIAVFAGAFLEGETLLALGGLAASRGHLDFVAVTLVALLGGFLGDQFFFFLGRHRGQALLRRFPRWEASRRAAATSTSPPSSRSPSWRASSATSSSSSSGA